LRKEEEEEEEEERYAFVSSSPLEMRQ